MFDEIANVALAVVAALLFLRLVQFLVFRTFPILFIMVTSISSLFFSNKGKEGKSMNFLGTIIIPKGKAGLVFKKSSRGSSPDDISLDGKSGYQAKLLRAGQKYHGYWGWKYDIELIDPIIVKHDEIGLIVARQGKKRDFGVSTGRYVDCDDFQDGELFLKSGGYEGKQSRVLTERQYYINPKLFDVITTSNCHLHGMEIDNLKKTKIGDHELGIVSSLVGQTGEYSQIKRVKEGLHESYQNIDGFIENGGVKGIQEEVLQTGEYSINPWCVEIKKIPITHIPNGTVGVIVSHTGIDAKPSIDGTVNKGEVGVWNSVLTPRNHVVNLGTKKVYIIPTMEITLEWSTDEEKESVSNYDVDLKPITIYTKDRFPIDLKLSQNISIKADEAPKLVSKILDGESMDESIKSGLGGHKYPAVRKLISKVIKTTIQKHFESISGEYLYLDISIQRSDIEKAALGEIQSVLNDYGVEAQRLSILVGYDESNPLDKMQQKISEIQSEEVVNETIFKSMRTSHKVDIAEVEKEVFITGLRDDAETDKMVKIMNLLGAEDYKEFERLKLLASMKFPSYPNPNLTDLVYSQFLQGRSKLSSGSMDEQAFLEALIESLKDEENKLSHELKTIKAD